MQDILRKLAVAILVLHVGACALDRSPPAGAGAFVTPQGPATGEGVAAECRLLKGWDPWPPFHYIGFNGELTGFDVDLLRAMSADVGCELSFERDSWVVMIRKIRDGTIDLLTGATMTEARKEIALFSAPVRREEFALYIRSGETVVWDADSLRKLMDRGMRLGVTDGYFYGAAVEAILENPAYAGQIIRSRFGEANIGQLLDGAIDAFIEDVFAANTMIRRLGFEGEIGRHTMTLGTGADVRIMYSRATVPPDLVARLDESLAGLQAAGEYDALMRRHLH